MAFARDGNEILVDSKCCSCFFLICDISYYNLFICVPRFIYQVTKQNTLFTDLKDIILENTESDDKNSSV